MEQTKKEIQAVMSAGGRVIEFTLATDPEFTPAKLCEYVSLAKNMLSREKGSGVLLCSDYLPKNDYENLKEAGLWGMVQWDETLDKKMFEAWHGQSPRKKNFLERIDNHDRAMQAGLQVATGILFGLSDYRYDVLMQIAKAIYLEKTYGRKSFAFGSPRLKPINGIELHTGTEVTDAQYELSLMIYKIAEPRIGRWLQTRETFDLNLRNMLNGDYYTYNCGNVTPGGYSVNKEILTLKSSQFKVNELEKNGTEKALRKSNVSLNYNWINNQ